MMPLNKSINAFCWDLYKTISQGDDSADVFFSHYSIAAALAMTFAGARNRTAKQMSHVLNMDEGIHEEFRKINEMLLSPDPMYTLKSANRLYLREGYDLLGSFLKSLGDNHKAGLVTVDFGKEVEKARQEINEWVSEQTAGKIENLIPPGAIDSSTSLVLVNAVYFKGKWAVPFSDGFTYKRHFHVSPAKTMTVDMMHNTDSYDYLEDSERHCQILGLPYKGNRLRMVVILPGRSTSLAKLEREITSEILTSWTTTGYRRKVNVHLPRFKLESTYDLTGHLSEMGAPDLFSQRDADLSGMTGSRDLFVSAAMHKAFVEVKEEGTEAAAATFMAIVPQCSMPIEREVIPVFEADRPFICLISDDSSGIILFMGRTLSPSAA